MSIQAQELRIGNLVKRKAVLAALNEAPFAVVDPIMIRDCDHYGENWAFEPIPLSPAWLERAHFQCEPVGHNDFGLKATWAKGSLTLNEYGAGDFGYSWGEEGDVLDVLYVHQLQNLYFSLTNKELPLNP